MPNAFKSICGLEIRMKMLQSLIQGFHFPRTDGNNWFNSPGIVISFLFSLDSPPPMLLSWSFVYIRSWMLLYSAGRWWHRQHDAKDDVTMCISKNSSFRDGQGRTFSYADVSIVKVKSHPRGHELDGQPSARNIPVFHQCPRRFQHNP
jgi:hypothetical protein